MKIYRKIIENKGSFLISIPKYLALELNFKKGDKISIERKRDVIRIKKEGKVNGKKEE